MVDKREGGAGVDRHIEHNVPEREKTKFGQMQVNKFEKYDKMVCSFGHTA